MLHKIVGTLSQIAAPQKLTHRAMNGLDGNTVGATEMRHGRLTMR